MQPLRIAIVGAGHRARILIEVMHGLPEFDLRALADPSENFISVAAGLAGNHVNLYSSHEDLFAREKLDAVIIASPGSLHVQPAIAAFQHGLHVLCEKPLATTVADADRMLDAGRRAGTVFMVAHQMRFDPIYERLVELVRQGELGEIRFASGYLYRKDWNPASWRAPHPETGVPTVWRYLTKFAGSSLLEDGLHELDILHYLIGGPVRRIQAVGGNSVLRDRQTIDHAAVAIEYEHGAVVQFGFSLFGITREEEMVILGTNAALRTSRGRIELRRKGAADPLVWELDLAPRTMESNPAGSTLNPSTARCLQEFSGCIRSARQPECDGEAGKQAVKIALGAQLSIDEKRPGYWDRIA